MDAAEDSFDRAVSAAALGHQALALGDEATLQQMVGVDPDPRVRATALAAIVRGGRRAAAADAWAVAANDADPTVRRRAAELAPALGHAVGIAALIALLRDDAGWVAEAAAFALGERSDTSTDSILVLASTATEHTDPLVRESAVAALGALGDAAGLSAVLRGCEDRPAVRRRAVLALAAFDGPQVEAALRRALDDADWQVRQNAEDLLTSPRSSP